MSFSGTKSLPPVTLEYSSEIQIVLVFIFRLEKEYTTIKNKEMEEQIEIKVCVVNQYTHCLYVLVFKYVSVYLSISSLSLVQRLRTENRLLKQRIETLEKVRDRPR